MSEQVPSKELGKIRREWNADYAEGKVIHELAGEIERLQEELEELHDAHDTLERQLDACQSRPVRGTDLVTDRDHGYAEGYSDARASHVPQPAAPKDKLAQELYEAIKYTPGKIISIHREFANRILTALRAENEPLAAPVTRYILGEFGGLVEDDHGQWIRYEDARAAQPPSPDAEDAARWRALYNCARITAIGSAGLEKQNPEGYGHVTLNFWTHASGRETETYPREWLLKFVELARATQTKEVKP